MPGQRGFHLLASAVLLSAWLPACGADTGRIQHDNCGSPGAAACPCADGTIGLPVCGSDTGTGESAPPSDTDGGIASAGTDGSATSAPRDTDASCGNGSVDSGECDEQSPAYCPTDCESGTDTDGVSCPAGQGGCYGPWGDWGACSVACGTGVTHRNRECLNDAGTALTCEVCGGLCEETRSCETGMACSYDYTDWSDWGSCIEGTQVRTRDCERSDGALVDCLICGGECMDSQPCTECNDHSINILDAENQARCNATLAAHRQACLADGCAVAAPTQCTLGGSPSGPGWGAVVTCS